MSEDLCTGEARFFTGIGWSREWGVVLGGSHVVELFPI